MGNNSAQATLFRLINVNVTPVQIVHLKSVVGHYKRAGLTGRDAST